MEQGLILGSSADFMFQLENKIQNITKENLYKSIEYLSKNQEQMYYLTGVK